MFIVYSTTLFVILQQFFIIVDLVNPLVQPALSFDLNSSETSMRVRITYWSNEATSALLSAQGQCLQKRGLRQHNYPIYKKGVNKSQVVCPISGIDQYLCKLFVPRLVISVASEHQTHFFFLF